MINRILPILLAASIAAVAAAGCGSDDEPEPAETSAAASETTAPVAAAAPYGTYVRRMTRADLERTQKLRDEHGPNQQTPPVGQYRLVIAQGSSQDVIKATDPGDFTVSMDLVAEDGVLRLTSYVNPAQGAFCGPDVPQSARYAFSASGSKLTIRPAKADPCADRDAILSGAWRKG